MKLGISESIILNAVSTFKGVKRRFSYVINSKNNSIDDYAHHPEEISKIHKSLRIIYPNEKISAIFQPHLFSRTINLIDDFANELSKFDNVILLEIYPRERSQLVELAQVCYSKKLDWKIKLFVKNQRFHIQF